MRLLFSILSILLLSKVCIGQEKYTIKATLLDQQNKTININGKAEIEETNLFVNIASNTLNLLIEKGNYTIKITAEEYVQIRVPISVVDRNIDLGTIYLQKDITLEKTDNLITLTEVTLAEEENSTVTSGLLQATKDVFLNRAAFDFGQAFFRVRGYDSKFSNVLINGMVMNNLTDGRPQWNNWGGLNDATRNQQFTYGLQPAKYNFGGILGTTNINTQPSKMRPGKRVSFSASNRTYAGRLMTSYTIPTNKKGITYSISASRRWAKQGYLEGTLYDAFSLFGALEYKLNKNNTLLATAMLASNRRGRSSAVTEEVFLLKGRKYNPYWGTQNGNIRNSRERKIAQPIFMFNHLYKKGNIKLNTGISYTFGPHEKSRLGYYNAPNPDATYYRYLPSFYINSSIGANFESAQTARESFIQNSQINWKNIYSANTTYEDKKAAYVFYNDIAEEKTVTFNTTANIKLNSHFSLDAGIMFKNLNSHNYVKIEDLLGAEFHLDIDTFSNTNNDANGNTNKKENDIFNYNYSISGNNLNAFTQIKATYKKWYASLSTNINTINYQREGLFKNERYPETSIGKSEKINFSAINIKGAFTYKITGRHWVNGQFAFISRPPTIQNTFINPRENNNIVANIDNQQIKTADVNYFIRLPKLTGRISTFYTLFNNETDVNFFFVESGIGSDFVQEVVTNINKKHTGLEIGLEYQLSSAVKVTGVAAIANYTYNNNPNVSINFDTTKSFEDAINLEGYSNLGESNIKGYKLAQGPQKAFAFGIEYRDPKYWWISGSANFMGNNYANISTITRTQSFYLDPDTGQPFPDATKENVTKLLAQKKMDDFYLLNLVGGKSWIIKGNYVSVFASVNNVFNTVFKTGGYEQSRNGNYGQMAQDNLSTTPSFGTKYWYGYGRTYFLNLAISF
ncbi:MULTISPECIES: TonB-dependent receptor [unclassified Cellulophaga]|uniref:TonB-dependent receptor n=1 Tax=unclassified Cellulophaga TaxID=2634405 RepID=UPI0026E3BBC1|nr:MULTISPECIES: TonB-dependent receptor [unclassified Cellulophaga]MDO6491130.1 TonB-dependent receptor [Cellulophaga sp. 2_MG-2023]MDO6495337.1 TonB-dependent receptor [Cellulophaga sp. 3_MG-2023]